MASSNDPQIKFMQGYKQETTVLEADGYIYHRHVVDRTSVRNTTYWRCKGRRGSKEFPPCRARLKITGDLSGPLRDLIIVKTGAHVCAPDAAYRHVSQRMNANAERLRYGDKAHDAYSRELATSSATEVQQLGKRKSRAITERLRRRKNAKLNIPKAPTSNTGFEIDGAFRSYDFGGESYRTLMYDSGPNDPNRLVLWIDDNILNTITVNGTVPLDICMDGTFKCRVQHFAQMYVVLARHTSGCFCPLIFSVTSNRTIETYIRLLNAIKARLSEKYKVRSCMIDFEPAMIRAFTTVYKNCILKLCYFHLSRNFFKPFKSLPQSCIESYYRLMTLPFVPIRLLPSALLAAVRGLPADARKRITTYVFSKYINGSIFRPEFWNMRDRCRGKEVEGFTLPRSNNWVEGFNHAWNSRFNSPHPSIYIWIMCLHDVYRETRLNVARLDVDGFYSRNAKSIDDDCLLQQLCEKEIEAGRIEEWMVEAVKIMRRIVPTPEDLEGAEFQSQSTAAFCGVSSERCEAPEGESSGDGAPADRSTNGDATCDVRETLAGACAEAQGESSRPSSAIWVSYNSRHGRTLSMTEEDHHELIRPGEFVSDTTVDLWVEEI
ncbi:hypothetical protein FOL47_001034, partial [Perkinsus chesapeaki]